MDGCNPGFSFEGGRASGVGLMGVSEGVTNIVAVTLVTPFVRRLLTESGLSQDCVSVSFFSLLLRAGLEIPRRLAAMV